MISRQSAEAIPIADAVDSTWHAIAPALVPLRLIQAHGDELQ